MSWPVVKVPPNIDGQGGRFLLWVISPCAHKTLILAIIELHTFLPNLTWVTPKWLCGCVWGRADAPGLKAQQASTAPWAAEQSQHFNQPATNQEDAQVL